MSMFKCPYLEYITKQIDVDYLSNKEKFPSFSMMFYPVGDIQVTSIEELSEYSSLLLHSFAEVQFEKYMLSKYIDAINKDNINKYNRVLWNNPFSTVVIDNSRITDGSLLIESIISFFGFKRFRPVEQSSKYAKFYSCSKGMIESVRTNFERSGKYDPEEIFTLLWNIMIMLSSEDRVSVCYKDAVTLFKKAVGKYKSFDLRYQKMQHGYVFSAMDSNEYANVDRRSKFIYSYDDNRYSPKSMFDMQPRCSSYFEALEKNRYLIFCDDYLVTLFAATTMRWEFERQKE